MRNRGRGTRRKNADYHRSHCGEVMVSGQPGQIVAKYEELAENAEKRGEHAEMHNYRQHAEHYRRMGVS